MTTSRNSNQNLTSRKSFKTLNRVARKEEQRRIELENYKIAKKIFLIKPTLQVREIENEYTMYKNIGQAMRRVQKKKIPVHEGKLGLLPPIGDKDSEHQSVRGLGTPQAATILKRG